MLTVGLTAGTETPTALALPVAADGRLLASAEAGDAIGPGTTGIPSQLHNEASALLAELDDPGRPGALALLPRPLRTPRRLFLVGVGAGDEAGWRAAGAALARSEAPETSITLLLPRGEDDGTAATRGVVEGLLLASYRFSLATKDEPRKLAEVRLAGADVAALSTARATARVTALSRDLTNMPSSVKNPAWFAAEVVRAAAGHPDLTVSVRGVDDLEREGFGGILAVGGGSASGPRLVELDYRPATATTHVVLVGKGITFDTGGISIKPREGMKLMRKDMGGAASVVAATIGAAELALPVRVTALAALAENAVGGAAYRPGDVIRHYGGLTTVTSNTDAEGRMVLADALAYAVTRLEPDLLVDLATLTGASSVALGKRTGALYSENDDLAGALAGAAAAAGELVWRMPLIDDYREHLDSDLADLHCSPGATAGAGSVVAALFLREFTGERRDRWAHIDMSAPSWAEADDGELAKGATGFGVRTLLRWLATLDRPAPVDRPPGPVTRV